jgi:methylmalonyl-CoA/ethylmalonyl-CoA epimerase
MNLVGLHQVAQHADDLERARNFYVQHLGARIMAEFDPPGLCFVELGGQRILLEKQAPSALLYFRTEDLDGAVRKLRDAGVGIESEPHVIFEDTDGQFGLRGQSERMAFVRDSEGNLVGLVERS